MKSTTNIMRLFKGLGLVVALSITLINLRAMAHDYIVPSKGAVIASISDKGVNRIAIESDRIAQVIGNEDEYIIESDANLGQIFLTPVLKGPQEISLRLVTERDKIIDVKFKIKRIEPQTIYLKYQNNPNSATSSLSVNSIANSNTYPNAYQATPYNNAMGGSLISNQLGDNLGAQQIIDSLKLVHSNKLQGVRIPTLGCLKQNIRLKKLKLVEATQYSLNNQMIVKAIISNTGKDELLLNESYFSNCMKVIKAISLDRHQLAYEARATIYMVGKDGK